MKLKYYLRGIGVGLILAVVLYSTMIIPRKYHMTDEEVMNRAEELGMVKPEEPDIDLSALSGTPSPTGEGVLTPALTGEDVLTPSPEGDDVSTPVPTGDDAVTPVPTGEGADEPQKPDPPVPPEEPDGITPLPTPTQMPPATVEPGLTEPIAAPTAAVPDGGKVGITVTPGMGSAEFAREAHRVGLVDNTEAFDNYLMKNGYASSIRVGTYSIPAGATYEEIARTVTGLQ